MCLIVLKHPVTLLFMKAKKEDPRNYRLVRLTSVPGKLINRVILEAVSKHIRDKKVTGSSLHGFMRYILSDQPD